MTVSDRSHAVMTEAERHIIALLAKEWELLGPPGILDISDVIAALPLPPSEALAALKHLFEKGLTDMNALQTSVFLTPEGYASAGAPAQSPAGEVASGNTV